MEVPLPSYRHPYWPTCKSSGMPAVTKFLACERTTLNPTADPASLGEGVTMLRLVHHSMPYKTCSLSLSLPLEGKKKHWQRRPRGGDEFSSSNTPLYSCFLLKLVVTSSVRISLVTPRTSTPIGKFSILLDLNYSAVYLSLSHSYTCVKPWHCQQTNRLFTPMPYVNQTFYVSLCSASCSISCYG